MLGRIFCGISVFLLVIVAVIIGFDDSFFEPIEDFEMGSDPFNFNPDELSAINNLNEKSNFWSTWLKRTAEGSRTGGLGRSKQIRYHLCYFNPISCFKKRTSDFRKLEYQGD